MTLGLELTRALDGFPLEAWTKHHAFAVVGKYERAADCPHCGKKEKLVVNLQKRRFHCWTCEKREQRQVPGPGGMLITKTITVEGGGGLLRLFAWFYRWSLRQAAEWVIATVRPNAINLGQIEVLEATAEIVDDADAEALTPPPPPPCAGELIADNLSYLRGRGITEPVARAYGLFGCHAGRFARRVVFPAWERTGALRYWQARATWRPEEDEARSRRHVKVLNPERGQGLITSEHAVFNLHRAVALGRGHVALCEGPISAIQAGDDAVALFGKRLFPGQLRELVRAGVTEVEVMFDGPTDREPAGAWAESIALAPLLGLFFSRVWLVRLPAGDPGDYDRERNASFRKSLSTEATASHGVQSV